MKFDDADSTFGQYRKEFIPKTKLTEDQFVTIDMALDLKECAQAYEQEIYKHFGIQDVSTLYLGGERQSMCVNNNVLLAGL